MKIELWKGFKEIRTADDSNLTDTQIESLIHGLEGIIVQSVRKELAIAIKEGPIHRDTGVIKRDGLQGNLVTRIQSYLWKHKKFQFHPSYNGLNNAYTNAVSGTLPPRVMIGIEKDFFWRNGDFGDRDSCYWGSNKVTRYWMRNDPRTYALKVYVPQNHDGRNGRNSQKNALFRGEQVVGFGRTLLFVNFPTDGVILAYNTYPNHKLVEDFTALIGIALGWPQTHKKAVQLVNNGEGNGWFYTNNRDIVAISHSAELLKGLDKRIDIRTPQPNIRDFPEYVGKSYKGHDFMADDEYVDKNELSLYGSPTRVILAREDRGLATTCNQCGKKVIHGDETHIHTFKTVYDKANGEIHRVCLNCFETIAQQIIANDPGCPYRLGNMWSKDSIEMLFTTWKAVPDLYKRVKTAAQINLAEKFEGNEAREPVLELMA